MSFEDLQAEISLLLTQMENQPQDPHELQELMREKINEMRAFGMPIPEEFLKFEKSLESDLMAADKGDNKTSGDADS